MFHDAPNRKGGRGELERNTQINEKAAHPLHCNGWAVFPHALKRDALPFGFPEEMRLKT